MVAPWNFPTVDRAPVSKKWVFTTVLMSVRNKRIIERPNIPSRKRGSQKFQSKKLRWLKFISRCSRGHFTGC